MKHVISLLLLCCTAHLAPAAAWLTDFSAGQAKAKQEGKLMLVLFTGSDWCPHCINLRSKALSTSSFNSYADEKLVLVEVDFPRNKPLSAPQKKANDLLSQRFHISGYPTLILVNGDGEPVARVPAVPDGPGLVTELQMQMIGRTGKGAVASAAKPKVDDGPPPPLFNGAPTKPPPQFSELKLQGISGPAGRRLAILNGQTLSAGEAARIRIAGRETEVRCVEIRPKSVLVALDGQNQEVFGGW
jgi:thioredoxin-related protein